MNVLQYLNPPPPIGGVTVSVKNLTDSLIAVGQNCDYKNQMNIKVKYEVGHVHASNKYKRLLQIVFLKLFCKKIIFTVHGLWLEDDVVNRLSLYLSDGAIFLNNDLYQQWLEKINTKIIILPSLFQEGVSKFAFEKKVKTNKKTLLLYSCARSFHKGEEVYGIEFALNALSNSKDMYKIILVDLDAGYSSLVNELKSGIDIDYYPQSVDFGKMISQCDIYIRPTCMDGSSVAIQESLIQGKRVIASDVVERGAMVELYRHLDNKSFLDSLSKASPNSQNDYSLKSVNDYLTFLKSL